MFMFIKINNKWNGMKWLGFEMFVRTYVNVHLIKNPKKNLMGSNRC